MFRKILSRLNLALSSLMIVFLVGCLGTATYVFASVTSEFQQEIVEGVLAVDIVDDNFESVAEPSVDLTQLTFGFECQTSTGTFGTVSEQIYVTNPDAHDGAWSVDLAADGGPGTEWVSATDPAKSFSFDDPAGGGCDEGQMNVDPSVGTLAVGECVNCTTDNVSLGSSAAFEEGVTDNVTIVSATSDADDIGDWTVQGVAISQEVPAEQEVADDYALDMTMTITAS